ncbi:hypothetical protein EVAR_43819_1 [Eumeta japonica]|uniref:Uncharacterized protein n=1 Tax=Eumeta variegata TaxID=151549 RepID=A0A4C1X163_EUMVA|nr:hypothetical protein EVAR_43819_1 [Eumeta japonica]
MYVYNTETSSYNCTVQSRGRTNRVYPVIADCAVPRLRPSARRRVHSAEPSVFRNGAAVTSSGAGIFGCELGSDRGGRTKKNEAVKRESFIGARGVVPRETNLRSTHKRHSRV